MTDLKKLLEPTEVMINSGYSFMPVKYEDSTTMHVSNIYKAMIAKSEAIPKLLAAVEVLKFYADEKNYLTIHAENPAPHVVMDDGHRAREAIEDLEE